MGALRDVLGIAGIRRLLVAWFGGISAEYGTLVAVSVYAFAIGGARAVALYGVLRIVPALVLTAKTVPAAAALSELMRPSIGMRTTWSQPSRTSRRMPSPSPPMTRPVGPR